MKQLSIVLMFSGGSPNNNRSFKRFGTAQNYYDVHNLEGYIRRKMAIYSTKAADVASYTVMLELRSTKFNQS